MSRTRCYVASPLGFTEAGRDYYYRVYLPTLAAVVEPVDPWSMVDSGELDAARSSGREREAFLRIGQRNLDAIRSSPLLVAYLEGQEPDSGTVVELGFAAALGKTCFGLRSDLRQAGEPGVAANLQVEAVVIESGGEICASLNGLIERIGRVTGTA